MKSVVDSFPRSPAYHALLRRIHRRYPTITESLCFGPVRLDFTRAADPERVLNELADEEDLNYRLHRIRHDEPLHLPYWAELWDSARGLAWHLVNQYPDLTGISALDLGCGQGLSGCVAAALGARVLFADLESPALLFARLNSLAFAPRVHARQFNWQTDSLGQSFDLILGADILYERHQWESLQTLWQTHLKRNGKILLADPGRQTGDLFIDWIQNKGWILNQFRQPIPTRPTPIRIFQLSLSDATST